jgi:hypothetical protein
LPVVGLPALIAAIAPKIRADPGQGAGRAPPVTTKAA